MATLKDVQTSTAQVEESVGMHEEVFPVVEQVGCIVPWGCFLHGERFSRTELYTAPFVSVQQDRLSGFGRVGRAAAVPSVSETSRN